MRTTHKHVDKSKHMELRDKFFYESAETYNAKFRNEFVDHHRELKAAVHKC